jgi:adenylate cyclase
MGIAKPLNSGKAEERLWNLIEERLKPGADTKRIDERIWDLFGEEWCVMFTDLSGFSRRVAKYGIIHFLQTIHESERLLVPVIEEHEGFVLKSEGDSLLVIFRKPLKAIQAAVRMNRTLAEYNEGKADEDKVLLCAGLGFGRLLRIGESDVFGAEVNAASKLGEDTAKAGEILLTDLCKKALPEGAFSFSPMDEAPPGAEAAWRLVY